MARDPTIWIQRHAGLVPTASDPSVAEETGAAGGDPARLHEAVEDYISALGTLNTELNGEVPSESMADVEAVIPRTVAYSVAEVARMLREAGAEDEAWLAETAWLAVLAGDVDDLRKHLRDETVMRRR